VSDLLDRTATGVRLQSRKRTPAVHRLVCASLKDDMGGRQYKTGCHRYLYADEGAILTTRQVDCAECIGTAVPRARLAMT
jgi:hypothetical protein